MYQQYHESSWKNNLIQNCILLTVGWILIGSGLFCLSSVFLAFRLKKWKKEGKQSLVMQFGSKLVESNIEYGDIIAFHFKFQLIYLELLQSFSVVLWQLGQSSNRILASCTTWRRNPCSKMELIHFNNRNGEVLEKWIVEKPTRKQAKRPGFSELTMFQY